MIWMLLIYLLLGVILLTFWHSFKIIARAGEQQLSVDALVAARREKQNLFASIGVALVYAAMVLFLVTVLPDLRAGPLIVLTPVIYLAAWLFVRKWRGTGGN